MKAKSKMRLSKRILSLVLVIIMVLGMLPQRVEAGDEPYTETVSGRNKEYLNGWTITISDIYYYNKEVKKEYPLRVKSIAIYDSSNLNGSNLTYNISLFFVGCEDENITMAASVSETFSVDCTKDTKIEKEYTSDPASTKQLSFDY